MAIYPRGNMGGRVGLRAYSLNDEKVGEADLADERAVDGNIAQLLMLALGGEGQIGGAAISTGSTVPAGEWIIADDTGRPFGRETTGASAISFIAASGSQDLYACLVLQSGVSPDLIDEGLTQITFQTVLAGNPAPANHALKLGTGGVTASAFTSFVYDAGVYRTNQWLVGQSTASIPGQLHVVDGGSDNNPGFLLLYNDAGNAFALWIDTAGNLRFHTALPTDDDANGVIVGTGGSASVPSSRVLTAGNGLTGGGNLSADRTFTVLGDGGTITVGASGIKVSDLGIAVSQLANAVQDILPNVLISVAAQVGDVIQVTLQMRDAANNNLAARAALKVWLADSQYAGLTTTAPSGGWAVGVGYLISTDVTNKQGWFGTDALGVARLDLTEVGAGTWYLHTVVGDQVFVSAAITFV